MSPSATSLDFTPKSQIRELVRELVRELQK